MSEEGQLLFSDHHTWCVHCTSVYTHKESTHMHRHAHPQLHSGDYARPALGPGLVPVVRNLVHMWLGPFHLLSKPQSLQSAPCVLVTQQIFAPNGLISGSVPIPASLLGLFPRQLILTAQSLEEKHLWGLGCFLGTYGRCHCCPLTFWCLQAVLGLWPRHFPPL